MTRIEKYEIRQVYKNLYKKYTLEQLKGSLTFFIARGCNANNFNKDEYEIHISVLRNFIKHKLYKKYN